jgi:diaminopimelate epimerase
MEIKFTKMHGLGNDFVVINAINQSISLEPEQVRFIANRRFGIGCDQILLIESSNQDNADFRYRIYNSDGGEVEQCGNGARCFAQFVRDEGLSNKSKIPVITKSGLIVLKFETNGDITVDMGTPILEPEAIPFLADNVQNSYQLNTGGETITFAAISMGNPHAVLIVDDVESAAVEKTGKILQNDKHFPSSVNVGFMQVIDPQHIKLRVYERGAGETLACGTGACAAVVAGRLQGLLDDTVDVKLPGGHLSIHWAGAENPVMMTGPTATVFKGILTL